MFHFPATPPTSLYIQPAATSHQTGWVTPFGNPGITVQLATPPGISQPHTSFIGHPAPRHPPCALHNLTNQHHKLDRSQNNQQPQVITGVRRSDPARSVQVEQRHSRTLYKSQTTQLPYQRARYERTFRYDKAQRRVVSEPQQGAAPRPARGT